jgi:hypothetical protein
MNKFDIPTQLDAINFHNTHDTLSVPKGMTLKQLVEDYDRLNNIINELEKMFDGDLDGFQTINAKGACNDIIEVIQNYKDKLKTLKKGNNND